MNSFVLVAFVAMFAVASAGLLPVTPIVSAYSAPLVSAYSAPLLGSGLASEQTIVAGPSGTISRTLAAPALTAYSAPLLTSYAAPSLVAGTYEYL